MTFATLHCFADVPWRIFKFPHTKNWHCFSNLHEKVVPFQTQLNLLLSYFGVHWLSWGFVCNYNTLRFKWRMYSLLREKFFLLTSAFALEFSLNPDDVLFIWKISTLTFSFLLSFCNFFLWVERAVRLFISTILAFSKWVRMLQILGKKVCPSLFTIELQSLDFLLLANEKW